MERKRVYSVGASGGGGGGGRGGWREEHSARLSRTERSLPITVEKRIGDRGEGGGGEGGEIEETVTSSRAAWSARGKLGEGGGGEGRRRRRKESVLVLRIFVLWDYKGEWRARGRGFLFAIILGIEVSMVECQSSIRIRRITLEEF